MKSLTRDLLSTAAMWPLAIVLAAAAGGLAAANTDHAASYAVTSENPEPVSRVAAACSPCAPQSACAANPCAAEKPAAACNPCNPCAAKAACNPCNPCAAKAACAPCNPCAAKATCAPCNPCAAKAACAPCNPCAASPCNPCNPCASGGGAMLLPTDCEVPSLRQAAMCNPCAAQKPAACNPCNPCAAKAACSPCNPCAAQKPAAACNPCNPCAAKAACSPCNPCAAKAACSPCNPCNPCAASAPEVEVPDNEMQALYDCLRPLMLEAYRPGGHWAAAKWGDWQHFSTRGYRSETHGGRFVHNAANELAAKEYGKFEKVKRMPIGSTLAKPSFVVASDGKASIGPLFIMEKMTRGWNSDTADWRYAMIMPNGSTFGITKGQNSAGMGFCHDCHAANEDTDYLMFLPEEFRRQ